MEKRFKVKSKKEFINEINEEEKNIRLNTFVVGGTALATITCLTLTGNAEIDVARRVGTLLLSFVSSKGLYDSSKVLYESMKRKTKLEDLFYSEFNEEYENRGKRK